MSLFDESLGEIRTGWSLWSWFSHWQKCLKRNEKYNQGSLHQVLVKNVYWNTMFMIFLLLLQVWSSVSLVILVAHQNHFKKKIIHLEKVLAPNDLLFNLDFVHILKTKKKSRSTNNSKQMKMSSGTNSTNFKVAEWCASTGLCVNLRQYIQPDDI